MRNFSRPDSLSLAQASTFLWEKGYAPHIALVRNMPQFAPKLEEIIHSEATEELKDNAFQEFAAVRIYQSGKLKCIGFSHAKESAVFEHADGSRSVKCEITYQLPNRFSAVIQYYSHSKQLIAIPSYSDVQTWKEMEYSIRPLPFYAIIYAQESKLCFWYSVIL